MITGKSQTKTLTYWLIEGEVLEGDDPRDGAFDLFVYIPTRGIYVSVNSKTAHAPPPGKPPGIWLFWKILVKFPAMLPV